MKRKILLFLCSLTCLCSNVNASILNDSIYVNECYNSWNNKILNCYKGTLIPSTYSINLDNFTFPIFKTYVTSHYGYRPQFKRFHKGVDLKLYIGDTVRSAFDGVVRIVNYEPKGYGYYVVVRHYNGLETVYGHLSKPIVKINQRVESGIPIGLGGNTGRSTGSHLHFETRFMGYAINPETLFDFNKNEIKVNTYTFNKHEHE